jgi:ankyrin repeat protein
MSASNAELYTAIQMKDIESVKVLLEAFTDPIQKFVFVNVRNEHGETPLHSATLYRQAEMVELLIASGANVNAKDRWGNTPLHNAVIFHHTKTANFSRAEIAKILIAHGAEVNTRNGNGQTPLHIAVEKRLVDMIKILIDNNANITMTNNKGIIPRDLASPKIQAILDNKILVRTMWSIWWENIAADDSYAQWPPEELLRDVLKVVEESKSLSNSP